MASTARGESAKASAPISCQRPSARFEDPASDHDVHRRAHADLADSFVDRPRTGDRLGLGPEDEQHVRPQLPDHDENLVIRHAAADEVHFPAVSLEQI